MPTFLAPIIAFLGKRWLHIFGIGLLIIVSVGVNYKLFVKDTNKTTYTAPSTHTTVEIKAAPFSCVPRIDIQKEK
jgi:hypothetical protein